MKCSGRGLPALLLYADFDLSTPERRAFKAHLESVASALREIERADDGEPTGAHDTRAIHHCLTNASAALKALTTSDLRIDRFDALLAVVGVDQPGIG